MTPKIELLTKKQVAAAMKVHIDTVYRMVKQGRFPPPAVIGGRPRWRVDDVQNYVDKQFKIARKGLD